MTEDKLIEINRINDSLTKKENELFKIENAIRSSYMQPSIFNVVFDFTENAVNKMLAIAKDDLKIQLDNIRDTFRKL